MKAIETIFRLITALLIAIGGLSSAEAVCYVDTAAIGANNGSSWHDAYTNPQFALLKTDCKEIWVAKGVYKPTLGTDPKIAFIVQAGVEIYGGFVGGETNRDARVPSTNLTVWSGDIDNNDANAATTGVDATPADARGRNSYHVVFLNGSRGATPVSSNTIIDGLTITGGSADGADIFSNGGGLYCYGEGDSGDRETYDCSPVLKNIVFSGNSAANDGGAVYADATYDGKSSPTFVNVTFHGNSAGHAGGAICGRADEGGINSSTLDVVFFNENSAKLGGAIFHEALQSPIRASESSPILTNVVFGGNVADTGGAMYTHSSNGGRTLPRFNIVTFNDNRTNSKDANPSPYGGGMYVLAEGAGSVSDPSFVNVTFNQNHATFGGAILDRALVGGVVALSLTNVTIDGNVAEEGGGLYNASGGSGSSVTLNNVILWDDVATVDPTSSEIKNIGVSLAASYSVMPTACPFSADYTCVNNFHTSPLLQPLSENGGFTRTMVPAFGSSAIDNGNDSLCPDSDQRGMVRPQGAHCEIGAVEVVPVPPPVADPQGLIGHRNTPLPITLTGSDANPGSHVLSFARATNPSHGTVDPTGDHVTYIPNHDYVGRDFFTFTVSDENGISQPAIVAITILDIPVAVPLSEIVQRNVAKTLTLSAVDHNPGSSNVFVFKVDAIPVHGTVTVAGSSAIYTPDRGYVGPDSFTYTATDEFGTSLPAIANLEVIGIGPEADPKSVIVPHNTPKEIVFSASDSTAGGPFHFTYALAIPPLHGTLSAVAGDRVTYTPNHDYSGPDEFSYTVTDENGTSVPADVLITVLPVDVPPPPTATTAVPTLDMLGTLVLTGLLGIFGLRGKFAGQ